MQEPRAAAPVASIEIDPLAPKDAPPSRVQLEAKLAWGGEVLRVAHVAPRGVVRVRDLGLGVPAEHGRVVARVSSSAVALVLPSGALVPAGYRMALRLGGAVLKLSIVADDAVRIPRARPERRVAYGVASAAALHLSVLGLVAHGHAPLQEEGARETLKAYLAAADDRAKEAAEAALAAREAAEVAAAHADVAATAASRAPDEGAAGDPSRVKEGATARVTRGTAERASKTAELASAASFGMLSILGSDAAGNGGGRSPFAVETGRSAMGNIWGATIDDAAGAAGLGLSGAGSGGGGLGGGVPKDGSSDFVGAGEGISLGTLGTIGHGSGGAGAGFGVGQGIGKLPGRHLVRSPSIRTCSDVCVVKVSGRLPPEVVQRVVRANFGRLRACYEQGLQRDASLEGRVVVKFVIDHDGEVTMASAAERTLSDAGVASCVARAFESMEFPKPKGGVVTVVYPLVFTPG